VKFHRYALIVVALATFSCGRNANDWIGERPPSGGVARSPEVQPPPGVRAPSMYVEDQFSFVQTKDKPVPIDVLFSINNAITMDRYIDDVRTNIAIFIDAFASRSVDFRVGMVKGTEEADGNHNYGLIGPNPVVQSSDPRVRERISANFIQLARSHRGTDKRTVQAWLEAAENPGNGALFQAGHTKVLIALTDSEDSGLPASYAPQAAARLSHAFGSDPWLAIGIGSPSSNRCPESTDPVTRLLEGVVKLSGGMMGRVCDPDYSDVLRQATESVFALLNEFSVASSLPAGAVPVDDSVRVFVDGKEIPNDPTNGFQWNSTRRSVTFQGKYLPPLRSKIEVRLGYLY
jgi:hypothetical protein